MPEPLPEDAIAMVRFAVESLLRTHAVPQRLDYFFKTQGPKNAWLKWQTAFMQILVSKDAVMASGNHFATKNRFYLEGLRKADSAQRLQNMLMEAAGVEQEATSPSQSPPPKQEESVPEPEEEDRPQPGAKTQDDAVMAVLERLQELMVKSLEIQTALAENVIHVRDRFEMRQTKLVERIKGLDSRLETIEQKLSIQPEQAAAGIAHEDIEAIADIVSGSVNSMTEVVGSLKAEVQVMATTVRKSDSDRIAQVQASLNKIASEFMALQQLTLESLSETPR